MSRLKTLGVLIGATAALVCTAAPASAIWVANNGQTTGNIKVKVAGEFTYPAGASEAKVKCEAATIVGQWQIQGAGQIKQQQKVANEGPHLLIQVKKWGEGTQCKALIGATSFEAKISECNLQLVQQRGQTEALGGVVSICVIKTGPCTIQVPVGMEKAPGSGTGINVGLKETILSNVGTTQVDKVNINGGGEGQLAGAEIFAQSTSGNPLCPLVSATEEAKLKGLEFEAEGVKSE